MHGSDVSSLALLICGSTEEQHYHKITQPPSLPHHPITFSQPINQNAGAMVAGRRGSCGDMEDPGVGVKSLDPWH